MIITIITGGSGSTSIQEGLYKLCPDISLNLYQSLQWEEEESTRPRKSNNRKKET